MENNKTFNITRMTFLKDQDRLKSVVDVSVNDIISIKRIKVVQGIKNLFVSLPQEKGNDGRWYDQVQFLDQSVFNEFEALILNAYNGKLLTEK